MGLDITAYRQIQKADKNSIELDEDGFPEDYDNYVMFYSHDDFADRVTDLDINAVYTRGTEQYGFRAGSYSGYNFWRNQLAKLAGYPEENERCDESAWKTDSGPFWELINFSDAEGVLGTAVCKKLLADFLAFDTAAQTHGGENTEYFYEVYSEFTKGLTLAADGGVLHFH